MYSIYKSNKLGDNLQPCTPSPIQNQSVVPYRFNCCSLTHIQVLQKTGKVVCYSHVFKNFPQFLVIHTIKDCSVVYKAEVDIFLELPFFLHDSMNVGNFISGSSDSLEPCLYIWKFSVHVVMKLILDFEHDLASM